MSGWNLSLALNKFSREKISNSKLPSLLLSPFSIHAGNRTVTASRQWDMRTYCNYLFVACILSALVTWWNSHPVCLVSFGLPYTSAGRIFLHISFLFSSEIGSQCTWLCSIAGNAEDVRLLRSLILNSTCQEGWIRSHQFSTGGCRIHQQENQTKHEVKFIWKGKRLVYHPLAVFKLFITSHNRPFIFFQLFPICKAF